MGTCKVPRNQVSLVLPAIKYFKKRSERGALSAFGSLAVSADSSFLLLLVPSPTSLLRETG